MKAYGAGLLSSAGELERFVREAELLPWDIERIASTSFDPTEYQPHIFVAPNFEYMCDELGHWLGQLEQAVSTSGNPSRAERSARSVLA